jgi:hypothetical protein
MEGVRMTRRLPRIVFGAATLAVMSICLSAPASAQGPVLVVIAKDSVTAAPVSGVRISVDGTPVIDTTDRTGIAHISGIAPGVHSVMLRRVGYAPDSTSVTLTPRAGATVELRLRSVAVQLPRVEATEEAVDPRLEGFMRRRAKGGGFFFTPADIDSSHTRTLEELLRGKSTAMLIPGPGGQSFLASHSAQLGFGTCWVQVFYDGVLIFNPADNPDPAHNYPPDLRSFLSRNLEAVEFYPNPATTPVQFREGAPACGTLVLWSRMH